MSNYNSLKAAIDANIKQNGRQEITGQILNSVLNQMVNTLGAGYQFAGVATTATNPGTPDAKVFYIANGKGTYTNFGGIEVTEDDVVVLYWDSSWHKVSTGIASQEKITEVGQEVKEVKLDSSKIITEYPVIAGGSNAKDIKGNFKAGVYGVLIRNIDTQNSGTYNIYITPSSSLFGYRNNCTIGIERTLYLQSDATKIGIADINPSITSSGNMEIIIRRIDSNESIIERRNNIEENYSTRLFGDFINGTLGDGGVYSEYQAENRVCSISMLKYSRDIVLTAQNGVIFGIHYFDDQGNWLGDSGWISGTLKISKNTNFKAIVNNGSNPLSIEYALDNVVVSTYTKDTQQELSVVGQNSTGVLTDFQIGDNRIFKFSIPQKWDITNVGSIGNNVITVGYKIGDNRVDIFQRTKQRLDSEGWPTEFFVEFPSFSIDGFYIFVRADSGQSVHIYFNNYDYGELDVPTIYQGQRIDLGTKYALSVIGRMTDYGTPSAQINAQGMAVYGNRYLIQGSNKVSVGTHFIIIDLQEKTLNTILFESLPSGQGFHMNNINLGGKYDDNDTLPLVYCSECYNEKSCKVVRFSNTFDSFTIIQTIKYSGDVIQEQNYMDWILDSNNNKIYAFKDSNNGLDLYGFNLPTLDNANVVLGDADIIETIRIPNISGKTLLTQGGTIINGKLWTAFGSDTTTYPGHLVISDLKLQQMVSFVDLSGLGECEAVSVYEKGILLCCASGGLNANSLSNPAYVYMIFNV